MESVRRKLLKNPRDTASKVSVLLFLWTIKIFRKGYQRTLELTDLYETLAEDRSRNLGDRLERNWNKQRKSKRSQPSLIRAIVATFWKNYLFLGMICVLNDIIIRLTQPYLLGRLLIYFRKDDSSVSFVDALWYAIAIITLNAMNMMAVNQYFIGCFHAGMKLRISVCSVIYRKVLKLSQTARGKIAVVNLLSNDVNRFDLVSFLIHSMWSAPLMSCIIAYLLWLEARWAGIIGIAVVLLVVPIQSYTGKLSSIFRLKTARRTDERIKLMDEIITGVRVIKMFAWEIPFGKMIDGARKMELNILRKSSYVRGIYMTFALFTTRMAVFCTMLSICLLYGSENLIASKIFVVSSYLHLVAHAMSQMFVRGIAELAEASVSVKRLQTFLEYEEINEHMIDAIPPESIDTAISVTNLTASWVNEENSTKPIKSHEQVTIMDTSNLPEKEKLFIQRATLDQISIDIKKGTLIGIIGPVGSGKSSFLQALLNELPLKSGSISINGTISYATQEPWIFPGTVRQNVIFSNAFDQTHYELVVKSCSLDRDFENFDYGDMMLIGDKGISLSGGQKARINLARCIYRKSDIYLFDDPLSAIDTHVGRHLFNECIGPDGFLAKNGCTRILVTHQVHFLKDADLIIVLRDGKSEFQGTPKELLSQGIDFSELLEMNCDESNDDDSGTLNQRQGDETNEFLAHVCQEKVAELEEVSTNKNEESIFKTYFRSGANYFVLVVLLALFIFTQILASASDYWVAFWTGQEERRNIYYNNSEDLADAIFVANDTIPIQIVANETIPTQIVTDNGNNGMALLTTNTCIYIHGALMIALFTVAITRSISFYTICVRASHKLHNAMFKGIISTSLRFFDTNPSGRILNIFSKDLGAVDENLPKSLLDATQTILVMTGSIFLTVVVRPIFIVPILFIGIIFLCVRRVYLRTSKDIKRMEAITRSPVFTHLSATLHGLPTIRALKAESTLVEEFDNHQDLHSSCWFMLISTSSAFGLCLDFLCFLCISSVTFTFLLSERSSFGNEVGLAITQIMALTGMLQWGIRQSAEVSNQLMSVERILQYRDLTPETQPKKLLTIGKEWPSSGKLEFRNVSYRYSDTLEPVLKNLNFIIHPNEKIGICGRTGAGKSSIIGALFRLAIIEGDILIDGVNTGEIDLCELRSKIAIIPQDPVLFSGSLRRNLDPFEEYPDLNIWQSLEEVELKDIANGPSGLQSTVMAGGSNYSVGQRQLICLARAILRKNKILILDEATANVDPHTDALIQLKIREKFGNCSVLTVAHRLHTIMDSDRVLVMDAGKAVEFAAPHELLQIKNGIFYEMVHTLGPQELERLMRIAAEKYKSSQT